MGGIQLSSPGISIDSSYVVYQFDTDPELATAFFDLAACSRNGMAAASVGQGFLMQRDRRF